MSTLSRLVSRHPLVSFYVLACLFGWSIFIAAAFGLGSSPDNMPLGPLAAAAIVTACQGRAELRRWARRLVGWAASPGLYALAVLAPVAIALTDTAINHLLGAPWPTAQQWATWPTMGPNLVGMLVMVGIGEEAGWSAFVVPLLARRRGLLASFAILASMRIGWHLPLMVSGMLPWVVGIGGNAGFQLAILVLFQLARSRWTLAVVWHTVLNVFSGGFLFTFVTGADQNRLGVLLGTSYAAVGLGALALWRLRTGRPLGRPSREIDGVGGVATLQRVGEGDHFGRDVDEHLLQDGEVGLVGRVVRPQPVHPARP